jgi:hypothetical protein
MPLPDTCHGNSFVSKCFCRFVTFRVTNLPNAVSGPVNVSFDLAPNGNCPTLGDFCYGYDYIGGCQYMIANQKQTCCPTSITSNYN